jgi:hypothetical protein
MRLLLCLAGAACFLSNASATVLTVTDTDSLGSISSRIPTEFALGTYNFTLDKFNSALGTLQSIDLTFHSTATYSVHFVAGGTGMSISPSGGPIKLGVAMQVKGPDAAFGGPFDSNSVLNSTVAGTTIAGFSLAANQSSGTFTNGGVDRTSTSSWSIDPSAFSYWEGAPGSTILLPIAGQNSLNNVSTTGSFTIVGGGTVFGDVSVTYTYDTAGAAPEPTTSALVGLGLLGAAWVARKRQSSRR